ncbi:MAG: hypothetical protein AABN95_03685 [Acidobacteriota bacterium]
MTDVLDETQQTWREDVPAETDSIRELVKSWASSTWAVVLLSVSQLGRMLEATDSRRGTDAFESVTRAVESQLNQEMRMFFQTGDQLQKGLTNAMFGDFTDADLSRLTARTAFDVARCVAATTACLSPGRQNRLAWLELQNKLETFNLFAHVDLAMDLPRPRVASLAELVERASKLGPYRSVWAMEGVGHLYAELCGARAIPVDLRGQAGALPASSLVALHAGAGLSFASRCLETITPQSADAEVRAALERFVTLCDENSHDAYLGATYEALGLAARNLHPQLLADIDRHLAEMSEELVGYFWHGVGRGIYFAPTNFLPNGGGRALNQALQESPHDLGRLNAVAGLVWALVLVNVRHPEVIANFLRDKADELNCDVFANGLYSAVVIWRDSSTDDEVLNAFCRYRPADLRTSALWETYVSAPCHEALLIHPVLRDGGCLGHVFRHQSRRHLVATPAPQS